MKLNGFFYSAYSTAHLMCWKKKLKYDFVRKFLFLWWFHVICVKQYCISTFRKIIILDHSKPKKNRIKTKNHTKYYSRVFDLILICHKQYVWNSLRVIQKWANQNHSLIQRPQPHILHWCTHLLDVSRHQPTTNFLTNHLWFW